MLLAWKELILLSFIGCFGGELLLQGPVFVREPSSSMVPVSSEDKRVTLNCEARGNPSPHYRWQLNGSDIDPSEEHRYRLSRGSLVLLSPSRERDVGTYQCFATNALGTIVSREARLQFAYMAPKLSSREAGIGCAQKGAGTRSFEWKDLENFKTKMRSTVSVREGQGVVLLCDPRLTPEVEEEKQMHRSSGVEVTENSHHADADNRGGLIQQRKSGQTDNQRSSDMENEDSDCSLELYTVYLLPS